MIQVVGLNAPDGSTIEARLLASLSSSSTSGPSKAASRRRDASGEQDGSMAEGEKQRAVSLAMEVIGGECFGVAEEANEVLR